MNEVFISAISYVVNGYGFLHTMGFTVATAIFIGAAIYDGDTNTLKKGLITIGSYAGLLFLMTIGRLWGNDPSNITHFQRYASLVTLIFVTVAYIIGMIIGVQTVKRVRKGKIG